MSATSCKIYSSLVTSLKWPHSLRECERETAYFGSLPSAHAHTLSLLPVFLPFPVESSSKAKILGQWLILLKFFCQHFFSKFFFPQIEKKCQNDFLLKFFQNFFFQFFIFHNFLVSQLYHTIVFNLNSSIDLKVSYAASCRKVDFTSWNITFGERRLLSSLVV